MSQNKFARGLYLLVDDALADQLIMVRKAELALQAGARVLQLRMKRTADRQAIEIISEVMRLARGTGATVVVNDRVDWALLANADGVHVGADDVPVRLARQVLGPHKFVGATCRSLADVVAAHREGADHAGLGPVFATQTKVVDAPVLGVPALAAIVRESPLPLVAIAGITLERFAEMLATGVHSAAVAGDVWRAADPAERIKAYLARYDSSSTGAASP